MDVRLTLRKWQIAIEDSAIAQRVAPYLFAIGYLNFLIYWIVWGPIYGGSAMGGKIENSQYFLEYHGRYTEVSAEIWYASLVQGYSVLALIPFMFLSIIVLRYRHVDET